MKWLITGHGQHGKDTVAELLATRLRKIYIPSSAIVAEEIMFPALKDKYGYEDADQCMDDRINHRKEWYDTLLQTTRGDPAALARMCYKWTPFFVGPRRMVEVEAIQAEFQPTTIFVFNPHKEPESKESCDASLSWFKRHANWMIENDADIVHLVRQINAIVDNTEA